VYKESFGIERPHFTLAWAENYQRPSRTWYREFGVTNCARAVILLQEVLAERNRRANSGTKLSELSKAAEDS
jgi:hypothetical protein